MKKIALFAAAVALLLPLAARAASPQKPGRWEVTSQMEMAGMPMKVPPTTVAVCISKEDVENPEKTLPRASRDKNANCKVSDYKIDGRTVTWTFSCEGDHPVTGSGKITYSGDSYDGAMEMKMGDREMTIKHKGKFIGPCDGTETNAKKK